VPRSTGAPGFELRRPLDEKDPRDVRRLQATSIVASLVAELRLERRALFAEGRLDREWDAESNVPAVEEQHLVRGEAERAAFRRRVLDLADLETRRRRDRERRGDQGIRRRTMGVDVPTVGDLGEQGDFQITIASR